MNKRHARLIHRDALVVRAPMPQASYGARDVITDAKAIGTLVPYASYSAHDFTEDSASGTCNELAQMPSGAMDSKIVNDMLVNNLVGSTNVLNLLFNFWSDDGLHIVCRFWPLIFLANCQLDTKSILKLLFESIDILK